MATNRRGLRICVAADDINASLRLNHKFAVKGGEQRQQLLRADRYMIELHGEDAALADSEMLRKRGLRQSGVFSCRLQQGLNCLKGKESASWDLFNFPAQEVFSDHS